MVTLYILVGLAIIWFWIDECLVDWRLVQSQHNPLKRFLLAMKGHWGGLLLFSFLAACLAVLIMLVGGVILMCFAPMKQQMVKTEPIYALEDNIHYVYRFSHGDDLCISYITEEADGFKLNSKDADYCHIQYYKDNPKVEKYRTYFKFEPLNYFFVSCLDYHYIFYIPYGSIATDFNIDLKGG